MSFRRTRGFDDAYSIGWRLADPMEEIRRYRTEIVLNDVFQFNNKDGSMTLSELIDLTAKQLDEKFLFKPTREYIEERLLGHNIKSGQLKKDPDNDAIIIKGPRF